MEEVLDVKDVARILKLSQPTVRLMMYRGTLPFIKLGRRCLFRPADIAALIEKCYRPVKGHAADQAA